MLFVVVLQITVLFVVHSMLMLVFHHLIHLGPMALLYHLKNIVHYAIRGGSSSHGFYCGVFYIGLHSAASGSGWSSGAALSFEG